MCTLTSGSLRSLKKAEVVATLTWLIGVWVLCYYSQNSGTHYILLLDKATATEVINHLLVVIFSLLFNFFLNTKVSLFIKSKSVSIRWKHMKSIWYSSYGTLSRILFPLHCPGLRLTLSQSQGKRAFRKELQRCCVWLSLHRTCFATPTASRKLNKNKLNKGERFDLWFWVQT